jgi:hypothetical protein
MSEKIYACLLRLYPAAFRSKYREEALQLYRDRLRDEPGLFSRCRLNFDLLIDALTGLPQAWRNSYTIADAQSLMPNADGVPTFRFLDSQPLQPVSILIGSTLSLAALSAIGLMMGLPSPSPSTSTSSRRSPIESVMQRLNHAATAESNDQESPENASTATDTPHEQSPAGQPANPLSGYRAKFDDTERDHTARPVHAVQPVQAAMLLRQNPGTPQTAQPPLSAPNPSPTKPSAGGGSNVPRLEVVSVKESKGNVAMSAMGVTNDGLVVTNVPLLLIVQTAFAGHFTNGTITGLPGWEMIRFPPIGFTRRVDSC